MSVSTRKETTNMFNIIEEVIGGILFVVTMYGIMTFAPAASLIP